MKERVLTPQQELFLASYTNPESDTFGNAYKSALEAGYSEEYSQNITGQMPEWLSENIRDLDLLRKAEKVLNETLEMDAENTGTTKKGDIFYYTDSGIVRAKTDVAKFVAETVGKKKYSKKSPLEGSDGKPITVNIVSFNGNSEPSPQV